MTAQVAGLELFEILAILDRSLGWQTVDLAVVIKALHPIE